MTGVWLLVTVLLVVLGGEPAAAQGRVGQVFDQVRTSVVVIKAKGRDAAETGSGLVTFGETGSGVLASSDGNVITAAHVVQAMDEVNVEFLGGEVVGARVVASEPAADLSLLRLDRVPAGVKPAQIGDSDKVRVGDDVLVIGAPYGLSYSLTTGLISARWPANSIYPKMPMAEFFQTTAVINQGNSGGPMFNMAGEVIGIVSHNISRSGGSDGLGFVVTINTAKTFLVEKHSFWSGMEGEMLSGQIATLLNVPQPVAFLVTAVAKDSPSARAGVRGGNLRATINGESHTLGGDIILQIAGVTLGSLADMVTMRERLGSLPAGSPYPIILLRGGKVMELTGRVP